MNDGYDAREQAGLPTMAIGGGFEAGRAADNMASLRRHKTPTVREQLQERIAGIEQQLAAHKAALVVLDETPGVEKVLDALRRIGV